LAFTRRERAAQEDARKAVILRAKRSGWNAMLGGAGGTCSRWIAIGRFKLRFQSLQGTLADVGRVQQTLNIKAIHTDKRYLG
jgi:hypothetical protein